MILTHSIEIQAPRERVFAHLSDPDKVKQWAQGTEERIYLTPEPHGVGTRFKQRIREGRQVNEYDGEILAYEPSSHLRVRMTRGSTAMTLDCRLSGSSSGVTHLDQSLTAVFGGLFIRAVARLFSPFIRQLMRKQANALKELAEKP
ncbi:SRPBCC family protein [Microvirga roseola]|uniref:SRPBCC family protein n=1 Tax=Microvirga roseola TaxID=2883126 RepID=UPI001E3A3A9F|nr:SRPBCC family protein [Microvirga roseola]